MMIRRKGAEMKEQSYLRTEDLAAGYDGTAWIREIQHSCFTRRDRDTDRSEWERGNLQS